MRSNPRRYSRISPTKFRAGDDWKRLTLKEYLCQVAPVEVRQMLAEQPEFVARNAGRLMLHLTEETTLNEVLGVAGGRLLPVVDSYPAISPNFVHHTRVVRGGEFELALKQGLSQLALRAPAETGEMHVLNVRDLGTHSNAITLTGYRDKLVSLEVHNKLGVTRDYLRMQIENIPLAAGGDLHLNIKPGIGGVDLVSMGKAIQATVRFEYVRGDRSLSSAFAVDSQDGFRFLPSTFITDNRLKVGRIDSLFGKTLSSIVVPPMQ